MCNYKKEYCKIEKGYEILTFCWIVQYEVLLSTYHDQFRYKMTKERNII